MSLALSHGAVLFFVSFVTLYSISSSWPSDGQISRNEV